MRTNIELDDELLRAAFRYTEVKTKRELVHLALREFIEHRRRKDLRELLGGDTISADYDYKQHRERQTISESKDNA